MDPFPTAMRVTSLVHAHLHRQANPDSPHRPVHATALKAIAALLPHPLDGIGEQPTLDEMNALAERVRCLPPADRDMLTQALALDTVPFRPMRGKQALAWQTLHGDAAQVCLAGGSGSGKSLPALLFAAMSSRTARLWRMTAGEHVGLQTELASYAPTDGLNKSSGRWELPPPWGHNGQGTVLQFAQLGDSLQSAARGQGVGYQVGVFDDAAGLGTGGAGWLDPEVIAVLSKWNRTTEPGLKTKLVFSCNPPLSAGASEWIKQWWSPWLDSSHPNPAADGEVRWFDIDNRETEPHALGAVSRTCVRSTVHDNVFLLRDPQYLRNLEASDPVLKAKLLHGSWDVEAPDAAFAVFPTAWIDAAFARYEAGSVNNARATAWGLDVAHGGRDNSVLAMKCRNVIGPLIRWPGHMTPDGNTLAQLVLTARGSSRAPIHVDVIGWGAGVTAVLQQRIFERCVPINVAQSCKLLDETGNFGFANVRSWAYWNLRGLLDPSNPNALAICPDKALRTEMQAVRFAVGAGKLVVDSKEEIQKRISRSPDALSAVILAAIPANSVVAQTDGGFMKAIRRSMT